MRNDQLSPRTIEMLDRRRPGRVEFDNPTLVAMLRRPGGAADANDALPIDEWIEDGDDLDRPPWSDRTILRIMSSAAAVATVLWASIAFICWQWFIA